jgi:hypothetical protein
MKRLLISGAAALSLVGLVFVAKADDRVYVDRSGHEYTREHRGVVGGTMSGLFGGHRERTYLDEDSRDNRNYKRNRNDNRGDRR